MCIKAKDNLIFARLYAKELRVIFSQSGTLIKQVELERPIYFSILVELTCYKFNLPAKSQRSTPQAIFEDLELPFELTCTRMLNFGAILIYPVNKVFVYTVVASKIVGR